MRHHDLQFYNLRVKIGASHFQYACYDKRIDDDDDDYSLFSSWVIFI